MIEGSTPEPFFLRSEVLNAIARLGRSENLSVLAGAGVSMQARLPPWDDLVLGLLRGVASEALGDAGDGEELGRLILEKEGPMAAATLAASRFDRRNRSAALAAEIYSILYCRSGEFRQPNPGSAALAIARAQAVWGKDHLSVATTNYDLLIEDAMSRLIDREKDKESSARKYPRIAHMKPVPVVGRDAPRGEDNLPIWHLHGYVGPGDKEYSDPILTEVDYHQKVREFGWQQQLLEGWLELEESPLLIVGASLRDPDILRILFTSAAKRKSGSRKKVVALLPRTRQHLAADFPEVVSPAESAYEELSTRRWAEAGVSVLYYDLYFQPAQFINEIVRVKTTGKARQSESYGSRLDRWYKRYCKERLDIEPTEDLQCRDEKFALRQPELSRYLQANVRALEAFLYESIDHPLVEQLSLHVWSRYPDERSLAMTGASDRSWATLSAVNRRALWRASNFTAVTAFSDGRWVKREDGGTQGHLGYQLAVPIELASGNWKRLPVGVITLSSSVPARESVLEDLDDERFDAVVRILRSVGAKFLDPDQVLG